MIQAFYSGAIGAQQQMKKMEIQGNNIANVNTYGRYEGAAKYVDPREE